MNIIMAIMHNTIIVCRETVAEEKLEKKSKVLPEIADPDYQRHTGLDWRTEILFRMKQ